MKKIVILAALVFLSQTVLTQVIGDQTKRKFTIGLDIFSDIWQDLPETMDEQTINPGVNIYGSYNYMIGKSNFSFSPGIGFGIHNLYSDTWPDLVNDSIAFIKFNDTMDYKKSKLTATYFDIPVELRFKSKKDLRFAVGFKFGFLMKMQAKYKGEDFMNNDDHTVIIKQGRIKYAESNRYGFVARLGYKWFNLNGYYSLSSLFREDKGPEMYPISVGITIIPF